MTSKTKYIVIVLLLLVLATTSVGLSTWNIHYQAIVGDADYTTKDPSTQESILNRYIYFDYAKDANGSLVAPQKTDYPISLGEPESIFTYTYDDKAHTPAVFVPSAENIKGSETYPDSLFLADGSLDLNWGIAGEGGVFDEIKFKYQYRLISMPYQQKGNSNNYCEITSIEYYENQINVYLTWKNGNNGNNQGENVLVELLLSGGNYSGFNIPNVQDNDIKNKISVTTKNGLAVGVNGFTPFPIVTAGDGWVDDAPTDAGVYQCRITAELDANANTSDDTAEHKYAANQAIAQLNSLSEEGIEYAAQVTYAILPLGAEMTQIGYDYQKATTIEQQVKARHNLGNTMPLAETAEASSTGSDFSINGNANSFYVTYGGAGFEISISSTFATLDNPNAEVIFPISQYLLTNANALNELLGEGETWDENEHYYTTYGFSSDLNYQITNPEVHYTILRREISIDSWTWETNEKEYNGEEQSPEVDVYTDTYGAELSHSWTDEKGETITKPKDVGSYIVWVSVGANYFLTCSNAGENWVDQTADEINPRIGFKFKITPKPIAKPTADTNVFTYNGSTQTYTIAESNYYTITGNTRKDAGDQDVTVALNDTKNYVWEDNTTADLTFTFAIAPKEITLTWGETNLTYTGNVQAPTASIADGQLVTGDTCIVSVTANNESKNVGSYTATATLDNTNYTASNPTKDFVINPKPVTKPTADTTEFTYNGNTQTYGISSTDEYTVEGNTGKDAGDQDVTVALNDTKNYVWADTDGETAPLTFTFTIAPKEITLTWGETNLTYTGNVQVPTASIADGQLVTGDTCTVSVETDKESKNVGSYTATATLDNTNYTASNPTQDFEIAKKQVSISWPNISLQYNGTAQAPTPTVNGVVSGDKCTVDVTTDGDCINVGTGYTATVESINNDNYVLTASSSTTFEITPKAVTISWSATTFFYDGTTKAPTASTNDILAEDAETCVLSFSGSGIDAKTYNATATLTGTSAGNYTIESGAEIQFIISRSANEVVWGDELTWTFGQKPATLPQIATAKFGGDIEITFLAFDEQAQTYSIPTTFDAITNAGNYYVAVTTSDDSLGSNFYGVTDGKVFKVEKATNTVTFDDGMPKGWTYGQKPADQTSVVSATSLFETQSITITFYSDETYTTAIEFANIVNAGTYYVKATSAETDNYAPGEAKASFAVAKGTYDMSGITFEAVEVEYTGSPINIYIKGTLPNGVSVSYVGNGKTNVADSGTVTANFTTTDSNYNAPAPMSATLTITRKKIAKPAVPEGTTFTYNGDDQTTTILAALGYDENTMTFRAASNAFINAGSKDIDFTPNANHCWNDGTTAEFRLSISIGELQVYVKSNILQFDYNTNGVTWDNLTSNIAATTAVVQGTALVSSIKYTNTTDAESTTLTAGGAIKVGSTYKIVYTVPNTNIELIGKNYCYLKYKTAKVDGAYYTIEDALATSGTSTITFEGNSSKADTYIHTMFSLIQDGTVPELSNITLDYTLTSGRTLIVPYDNSTKAKAQDKREASSNVYSALTIPSGINLTIPNNAKLYVGGKIYYKQPHTTATGTHGVLINNGIIDVQNGGVVQSYGYLKGTGMLNLLSGSKATDCLHTYDWPGGSAASSKEFRDNVFPANAWSFHNISCPTKIYAGAQYEIFLYATLTSLDFEIAETAIVIGDGNDTNCLFQPDSSSSRTNSYIFKYTQNAASNSSSTALTDITGSNQIAGQKDILEMHGDYVDHEFSVEVSGQTIKTSPTIAMPIGYMDVHIKSNGNVSLSNSDYLFLPGTKLVIDDGSTVTTASGIDVNFMTIAHLETLAKSNYCFNQHCVDREDSYAVVNGSFVINGNISGKIRAGSANAFLDLSNATASSTYKIFHLTASPYYAEFTNTATSTITDGIDVELKTFTAGTSSVDSIYVATSDGSGGYIWTVTQEEALSYTITTVWSTGESNTTTYRYFASDGAPEITPSTLGDLSKDYYDFDGWYTDSDHSTALDSQTVAADGSYTFYAKFTPTNYNVTYKLYSDTLGGTELDTSTLDGFVNDSSDSYSAVRDLELAKATCGDMTFDGWYIYNPLAQEGENPYIKLTDVNKLPITVGPAGTTFGGYTLGKDLTDFELVGILKELPKYTVTYKAQTNLDTTEWSVVYTETNVVQGTFATTTADSLDVLSEINGNQDKSKYFDNQWYTDERCTQIFIPSANPIVSDITLYAKRMDKNKITVEYNATDGSVSPTSADGWAIPDGSITVTLPTPTRSGYNCNGWFTAASGGDKVGNAGATYTPTGNITLYAQWTEDNGCFAPGTLITMADGTTKRVEDLVYGDLVLVFNHDTGQLDVSAIIFNAHKDEPASIKDVLNLHFSNGNTLRIVAHHGLFDCTLNEYVEISIANVAEYIGHGFFSVSSEDGKFAHEKVVLTDYTITHEFIKVYSPITADQINCFGEGILTAPGLYNRLMNIFELDENMKVDAELMQADIDKYGLYEYAVFEEYVSYEIYCAFNGQYFKVAVEKGLITLEEIIDIILDFNIKNSTGIT